MSKLSVCSPVAVSLELPVLVVEGTPVLLLEPSRDAVEVEGVVASAPSSSAFVLCICDLVGLTVDAGLHDVVLANSTVINCDVYNLSQLNDSDSPQDQRETAFHFLISNLFCVLVDSTIICLFNYLD